MGNFEEFQEDKRGAFGQMEREIKAEMKQAKSPGVLQKHPEGQKARPQPIRGAGGGVLGS